MRRIASGIGVVAVLLALVALPVLAAKPDKDVPKTSITLHGTIEVATDADGKDAYSLKDGGKTYRLEAGPAWFFGDKYPLKPFVGKNVTIVGEIAEGSTEVDVVSVDGTELRTPGRPPWAGGWKVVGAAHPGWSQAKADRMKEKFGDCFPPGHCKDKPGHAKDTEHPKGDDGGGEPGESEAPD